MQGRADGHPAIEAHRPAAVLDDARRSVTREIGIDIQISNGVEDNRHTGGPARNDAAFDAVISGVGQNNAAGQG